MLVIKWILLFINLFFALFLVKIDQQTALFNFAVAIVMALSITFHPKSKDEDE